MDASGERRRLRALRRARLARRPTSRCCRAPCAQEGTTTRAAVKSIRCRATRAAPCMRRCEAPPARAVRVGVHASAPGCGCASGQSHLFYPRSPPCTDRLLSASCIVHVPVGCCSRATLFRQRRRSTSSPCAPPAPPPLRVVLLHRISPSRPLLPCVAARAHGAGGGAHGGGGDAGGARLVRVPRRRLCARPCVHARDLAVICAFKWTNYS